MRTLVRAVAVFVVLAAVPVACGPLLGMHATSGASALVPKMLRGEDALAHWYAAVETAPPRLAAALRAAGPPASLASASNGTVTPPPTDEPLWFSQRLDHRGTDAWKWPGAPRGAAETDAVFQQRYYIDDSFYVAGGPILYGIGGEGPMRHAPHGFMRTLAEERGALLVSLEHRFFGESMPTDGLTNDNLRRFLTIDQALADSAAFLRWLTTTARPLLHGAQIVTVGGSYPGALSAWFRMRYPDVTTASLSSSGVVLPILDFVEYDEQVATASGEACASTIRSLTLAVAAAEKAAPVATRLAFNASADMSDFQFAYMLADSVAGAVQYSARTAMCHALTTAVASGDDAVAAMAWYTRTFWGESFAAGCGYDNACLRNETTRSASRAWLWMTCNEVGWNQIAPLHNSMRSEEVSLAGALQTCVDVFGRIADPVAGIAANIAAFGGAQPPVGSRIFFSNFGDDPWQHASVTLPLSLSLPARIARCVDCGHTRDLYTPSDSDPEQIVALRNDFRAHLDSWLSPPVSTQPLVVATAAELSPCGPLGCARELLVVMAGILLLITAIVVLRRKTMDDEEDARAAAALAV